MTAYPEIYVLRHGQTEWNATGRHQGQGDSPLTALGRAQAAAQGRLLERADIAPSRTQFYASPQGRAWATAEIALAATGASAVRDDRLKEVHFGAWEGLTAPDIDARWPGNRAVGDMFDWHFTAPGGESFDAVCLRAQSFLDALIGPAVIVTHGITSRVLRGLWLGLDRAGMSAIDGGQGVVYRLRDGVQTRLSEDS